MRLCGIDRIILGSSGHGGREAAERLVQELRDGRWTGIAPDGPGGPPRVAKRGVGHIAAQTGAPIVPLQFTLSRALELPTWDRKRLPCRSPRSRCASAQPIFVDRDNFDAAIRDDRPTRSR